MPSPSPRVSGGLRSRPRETLFLFLLTCILPHRSCWPSVLGYTRASCSGIWRQRRSLPRSGSSSRQAKVCRFSGIIILPWFHRYKVLASSDIVLIFIFWPAAAARDQPAVDALTVRVREIQGMTPTYICASCLHLSCADLIRHYFFRGEGPAGPGPEERGGRPQLLC